MRTAITLITLLGLSAFTGRFQGPTTTSSLPMPSTAVATNCPAPASGITNYCWAADAMQVSPSGGAYQVIWPAKVPTITSITVNGVAVPIANGVAEITVPTKAAGTLPLQ